MDLFLQGLSYGEVFMRKIRDVKFVRRLVLANVEYSLRTSSQYTDTKRLSGTVGFQLRGHGWLTESSQSTYCYA